MGTMSKNKTIQKQNISAKKNDLLTQQENSFSFLNNFKLQAILISFIVLLFYGNTINNEYALDDILVIENNQAINKGLDGLGEIFTTDIFDSYYKKYNANNQLMGGRYRPLSMATFAIEQEIWGESGNDQTTIMTVRHVINVLLYILSLVILLYFLRKVLFSSLPLVAFLTTLIFAIHPLHTEVVANIKSRDEILSFLFITLTCIQVYRYSETKKIVALLLSSCFFFLALLSKEYAVSLLVLLPILFYVIKKETSVNCAKSVAPLGIVFVIYVILRYTVIPFGGAHEDNELLNNPYLLASVDQILATKIATLMNYLKLLVYPISLSSDYSYNQIPYADWSNFMPWFSIFIHLGLIITIVFLIIKRHYLAFAISCYLGYLVLVSNLFLNIGATMGERLIYHSSLGFSMVIAYLLYTTYEKIKSKKYAMLALSGTMFLLTFSCGNIIITRNTDWKNNSTLARKDVLTVPNSVLMNANAGVSYLNEASLMPNTEFKKETLQKALLYLNKAISLHPGFTVAHINRGSVLFQLGEIEKAKEDWDIAQKQFPSHPELPGMFTSYYINSSIVKGSKGLYNEAIGELKKGEKYDSNNLILLFNMGYYYNLVGNKNAAINKFEKIVKIAPKDTLAIKCVSYIDILKKSN